MARSKLPITEELDFQYLLTLMPPLESEPEFSWLPELFSIVGHESLILLCKYCGGETIKIPTLNQLVDSIECLQIFYDVYIKKSKSKDVIPLDKASKVEKILEIYNASDN